MTTIIVLLLLLPPLIDRACIVDCPHCGGRSPRWSIKRRRRNTRYCRSLDANNWLTSCEGCYQEDCDYMADMWSDYYQGCM